MSWSEEGYKRILEASKRGRETQRKKAIANYYKNPKICPECENIVPWEKRENKFCDSSCAASFNNRKREKKKKRYCKHCGNEVDYPKIYCNQYCQNRFQRKEYIRKWKNGEVSGIQGQLQGVSQHIRNYLIEKYGHKCSICGNEEWMGEKIPLVLDHIDGDSSNCSEDNLRFVCGNCDMQLPTYKSKNKGNGRHYRNKRYIEGKSY